MNTKDRIETIVIDSIKNAVQDSLLPDGQYPQIKVEYPKDQKFGDYATPFALECAKVLKKSPMETGAVLARYIEKSPLVGEVDVAKPGFINIFISFDYLYDNLQDILIQKENYGKNSKTNPRKVNIEFVSANPTGPLNIVSARAAALGDTLANLMEMNGDTVDREFYVNDYGNQVYLLGKSVLARVRELRGEKFDFPEDGYRGEYLGDIAKHIIENYLSDLDAIHDEEKLIDLLATKAIEYNVAGQKKDLQDFHVSFKTWFRERTLHENNDVTRTLEKLESLDVIYPQEGKKIFSSTAFGDDKDRVVLREDGRPTYFLADITYHCDKLKRGYDLIVDIWGPDHHGHIARLAGAMKSLKVSESAFKILIAQQVNLIMEGETVKMSKRLGRFSTMRELIDEIGVDVARYFFVMRSFESHLDFDLALAKKDSSENPVFYLQYAYARICSLFSEAEKRGSRYNPLACEKEYLNNPEGIQLLKLMLKFPEEIADAATNYEPHRICNFLMRLAQAFHRFYTEHRILSDDTAMTNANLTIVDAVRTVMKQGLNILGLSAPERM